MQILTYNKVHHAAQLHDELLAALPPCRPITRPDGQREAAMRVESGRDGFIRVTVPDDVAEADVRAVIDAHQADPNYGADPLITEGDVLEMNPVELRRWLARCLLLEDPHTL